MASRPHTLGIDAARANLLKAVLACRTAVEVPVPAEFFVAAVGGISVTEPAADLAVALAMASVVRRHPVPPDLVVFGELGLAGEVRTVPGVERRLAEAHRAGFTRALVPASAVEGVAAAAAAAASGMRGPRGAHAGRSVGNGRFGARGGGRRERRAGYDARVVDGAGGSQPLNDALALIAPGTALREGLDRILQAKHGALIIVGDDPAVLSVCTGGFLLDAEYTPQRLSELAKMDGAIILAGGRLPHCAGQRAPHAQGDHPDQRDGHPSPHGRARGPLDRRAGGGGLRGDGDHRRLPQRPQAHDAVGGLADRPFEPGAVDACSGSGRATTMPSPR